MPARVAKPWRNIAEQVGTPIADDVELRPRPSDLAH
jgi:hypothetical protein